MLEILSTQVKSFIANTLEIILNMGVLGVITKTVCIIVTFYFLNLNSYILKEICSIGISNVQCLV